MKLMKSYKVFHEDDEGSLAPAALGASFYILDSDEEFARQQSTIGDSDYAILKNNGTTVTFLNHGQPFEFCGVGALAIAEHLQNQNAAAHISTIQSQAMTFDILQSNHRPAVCLPHENHTIEFAHLTPFGEGLLFTSAACFALPRSRSQLRNFEVDAGFREYLFNNQLTVLLYNVDTERKHLYFRYFTSFNNKLEDQATGSIFRYLPHLPTVAPGKYTLSQLSESGALMHCQIQADNLTYWGNVQAINTNEGNR